MTRLISGCAIVPLHCGCSCTASYNEVAAPAGLTPPKTQGLLHSAEQIQAIPSGRCVIIGSLQYVSAAQYLLG